MTKAGTTTDAPPVAGVDGARSGWLAVIWRHGTLEARLAAAWQALDRNGVAAAGIDMPIGLADAGPRACDIDARRLLPPGRASSVFAPPRRYMLHLDYVEANAAGKAREGKGLTKQAWYIGHKIAELDTALQPDDQGRVFETHPELVFHRLNEWRPLPRKKTSEGRAERLRLLRSAGLPDPAPLMDRYPRGQVQPDDVLDAAACALAARDIAVGAGRRLPEIEPATDARGLRMEIWY